MTNGRGLYGKRNYAEPSTPAQPKPPDETGVDTSLPRPPDIPLQLNLPRQRQAGSRRPRAKKHDREELTLDEDVEEEEGRVIRRTSTMSLRSRPDYVPPSIPGDPAGPELPDSPRAPCASQYPTDSRAGARRSRSPASPTPPYKKLKWLDGRDYQGSSEDYVPGSQVVEVGSQAKEEDDNTQESQYQEGPGIQEYYNQYRQRAPPQPAAETPAHVRPAEARNLANMAFRLLRNYPAWMSQGDIEHEYSRLDNILERVRREQRTHQRARNDESSVGDLRSAEYDALLKEWRDRNPAVSTKQLMDTVVGGGSDHAVLEQEMIRQLEANLASLKQRHGGAPVKQEYQRAAEPRHDQQEEQSNRWDLPTFRQEAVSKFARRSRRHQPANMPNSQEMDVRSVFNAKYTCYADAEPLRPQRPPRPLDKILMSLPEPQVQGRAPRPAENVPGQLSGNSFRPFPAYGNDSAVGWAHRQDPERRYTQVHGGHMPSHGQGGVHAELVGSQEYRDGNSPPDIPPTQ